MLLGSMSSTPVSDAMTSRLSFVTVYLKGRSPFRSSTAPRVCPSLNVMSAGPSHGSMIPPWNS